MFVFIHSITSILADKSSSKLRDKGFLKGVFYLKHGWNFAVWADYIQKHLLLSFSYKEE